MPHISYSCLYLFPFFSFNIRDADFCLGTNYVPAKLRISLSKHDFTLFVMKYDSESKSGIVGAEWLSWCWNWKLIVPFNLANLLSLFHPCSVKTMLLPFQRAGHLVRCWEQSGPSCKTPARQVLHWQHLHHTERK